MYENNSVAAGNQTGYDKKTKTYIAAQTRALSKRELHEEYLKICNDDQKVSYSTFCGREPIQIKPRKRVLDACGICENGKKVVAENNKRIRLDLHVTAEEKAAIQENLELLKAHKTLAAIQRDEYNRQMAECQPGNAVVVIDFKENLRIGSGPTETGKEFFSNTQITCLGFVMSFRQAD